MSSPPSLVANSNLVNLEQMHQITIRTAVAEDQKALEALQRRASLNNPGDREALLANPDAIELPLDQIEGGNVFVAEMVGSIQGFAAILPRPDGNSELDALFVEPSLWRQGVGRRLVEYCCSAAKSAGSTELHVVGNLEAKRFYEASGFMSLGTKQMRFGVSLLMKRALP
jgi:N-acetylglutamate synthase-like GNAT family acetyltransferase